MKKTVRVRPLIRALRTFVKEHKLLRDDHTITWRSSRLVGAIAWHLAQELGLDPSTPEYTRFMDRIWGKRTLGAMLVAAVGTGKTVSKETQWTPEYLEELRFRARQACTCDGGNTNGCSACVAERRLKQYEATAGHHQTGPERTCP